MLTGACAPRQEGADKILFKKCDAYEGKNLLEMESKGLTQFPMIFVAIDGQGMGSMCVSAFAGGRTRVHVARGAPRACRRERRAKKHAPVSALIRVYVCARVWQRSTCGKKRPPPKSSQTISSPSSSRPATRMCSLTGWRTRKLRMYQACVLHCVCNLKTCVCSVCIVCMHCVY